MPELEAFIRAAKERGASDDFLVALLSEHGWPRKTIYQILGRYYSEATGVPIPQPQSSLESAREAFFHLLAFATLASWVFSSGSIWFELIDSWFPDPARSAYASAWQLSRVSWQMACLIVAFPAFVWATRSILRDVAAHPEKQESGVRRWLTNIALLMTALIFIGDLVSFVAAFLQGELTARFVLKSVTVFVLAGGVFLYYGQGIGRSGSPSRRWHLGFGSAALASILLALALGFLHSGSPAQQRLRAEDRRRVADLNAIAQRIRLEWSHGKTPCAAGRHPPGLGQRRLDHRRPLHRWTLSVPGCGRIPVPPVRHLLAGDTTSGPRVPHTGLVPRRRTSLLRT